MSCSSPLLVKSPSTGSMHVVPCGRCLSCRIANRESWTNRFSDECLYYGDECVFVTLTYNDYAEPWCYDNGETYPTLWKRDVQNFLKRLRYYRNQENPIRRKLSYICVGEYGSNTQRPHYHLCVCGLHAVRDLHLVSKAWQLGFVDVRPLNHARIRYTLKYMDKQLFGQEALDFYRKATPPFRLMSKSIGSEFLEEHANELSEGFYVKRGRPVAIPRYYTDPNTRYGSLDLTRKARARARAYKKYMNEVSKASSYFPDSYNPSWSGIDYKSIKRELWRSHMARVKEIEYLAKESMHKPNGGNYG